MKRTIPAFLSGLLLLVGASLICAQDSGTIQLPAPQTEGGKPLMQVLKARHSSREFGPESKLPMQLLSNLLWAANGVNRPDGKRTAPSAMNWQNIDIYAATADGLYLYDAQHNSLKTVLSEDVRAATGQQEFVKSVPLNLVFVADYAKAKVPGAETWSAAGAGFVSQNVYLFCASEGLATVVRGLYNGEALGKTLKLRPDQKVVLTQSVGYPKKQ